MEDEDIFEDAMEDVGGGEVQGYPLHEVLNTVLPHARLPSWRK